MLRSGRFPTDTAHKVGFPFRNGTWLARGILEYGITRYGTGTYGNTGERFVVLREIHMDSAATGYGDAAIRPDAPLTIPLDRFLSIAGQFAETLKVNPFDGVGVHLLAG